MARIRMLKPEFFNDADIGELTFGARLFFQGLWVEADREGRLRDDMRQLKVKIFPYNPEVVMESLADELEDRDMIRRYEDSDGRRHIWVRNFLKHQHPHHKEPPSVIAPCEKPRKVLSLPRAETGPTGDASPAETHLVTCQPDLGTSEPVGYGYGILSTDTESGIRNLDQVITTALEIAPRKGNYPPVFEAFWAKYPRKTAKGEALKAWLKIRPSPEVQLQMLEALDWQVSQEDWVKEGGKYVPYPATYLGRAQWLDERPTVNTAVSSIGRLNRIAMENFVARRMS